MLLPEPVVREATGNTGAGWQSVGQARLRRDCGSQGPSRSPQLGPACCPGPGSSLVCLSWEHTGDPSEAGAAFLGATPGEVSQAGGGSWCWCHPSRVPRATTAAGAQPAGDEAPRVLCWDVGASSPPAPPAREAAAAQRAAGDGGPRGAAGT